jgi:hypothetical protein
MAAAQNTVTFDYNFTGGISAAPSMNFTSPASTPPTSPAPSILATPSGGPSPFVTQSAVGLGVQSATSFGIFGNAYQGGIQAGVVDGVGFLPANSPSEHLILTITNTNPNLTNFSLTGLALSYFNIGGANDLQVSVNGGPATALNFPTLGLGIGTTLPVSIPIAFTGGTATLDFSALTPIITNSDAFALAGLTLQAEQVPEPASLLVWSAIGGLGFVGSRLRRKLKATH